MGRSRAVSRPADDDPNQRPKRKRPASGAEPADTTSYNALLGQGHSELKGALYHCNYCHKDISGKIRIKCAMCPDFDLCIECFSVGAEVTPHKSNHLYRVMDNLSFPLICPEWNADEETLLLEGIEMYGFGNWFEVAEHVGTKSKAQCISHYNAIYMNSPCFPLPDLSHVMGKSKEELLAMAKEVKKEVPMLAEVPMKAEPPTSARKEIDTGSGLDAVKKTANLSHNNIDIKEEESQVDRSIGEKKPRLSGDKKPSLTELSGYNSKRQEFEIEYDNDAELLLADMEFKDSDTNMERELKLRVLHIYSKRLDERKRRKNFILERNLLYPDTLEKNLSPEEKEIYKRFKVFMRFHSKEQHEEFIKNIVEEHRIVQRIQDLQQARAAGCRMAEEANRFIEEKRRKEAEESALRIKESLQAGPSGKGLPKPINVKGEVDASSPRGLTRGSTSLSVKDSTLTTGPIASSLDDWDIAGLIGSELLSETEKQLCREIRILPSHYLKMLQIIATEVWNGNITKKTDAHSLFMVDPSKVDKVYDMVVEKGITSA